MVYIGKLKKNIWPGYVKPKEDELFSSWFVRLAAEHKTKTYTFSKHFFNNLPIWNRDIDKSAPIQLLQKISDHTPMSHHEINNMLLSKYEGIIFEKFNTLGMSPGINSLGIKHRKRTSNGLLYCPICLSQEAYYKTSWRLMTSLVCTKCNVFLQDECPKCKSPISFHRLENGNKNEILTNPLYLCWNCMNDLRLSDYKSIKCGEDYIYYQKMIDKIIEKGYSTHTNYSFLFFKVLFHLCTLFSTKSTKLTKFRNGYIEKFRSIPIYSIQKDFNSRKLHERKEIQLNSIKLLLDWPNNFLSFKNDNRINYSDFAKDIGTTPYWIEKVLKDI